MRFAAPAPQLDAPLVTFTYHLQPGVRDPWGAPLSSPAVVEARAKQYQRMSGSLESVVRAASLLAARAGGGAHEAHAVVQAADGAWLVTRLHSVSYGGRMEGAPAIDGPLFALVVSRVGVTPREPRLRAIVGGLGWIPVIDGRADSYRPLPSQP